MARYEELRQKRVMVTGAASGIGLATAQKFASEGARVFLVDSNDAVLKRIMDENENFTASAVCDVSKESDVCSAFEKMDALLGGIDILISNAGISIRRDFTDIEYDQWKKVMDVNLGGCSSVRGRLRVEC